MGRGSLSASSDISSTGAEAKVLSEIELAVRVGAAKALKARAAVQREKAADGTSTAGEKYPDVVIRTGEAAVAARLADEFERVAAEFDGECAAPAGRASP
jgi:hypothetical protein